MEFQDKDKIELLRTAVEQIKLSLLEIENNQNVLFHKSVIQNKSIEIFNLSSQIGATFEKPIPVEVKKPEPVIENKQEEKPIAIEEEKVEKTSVIQEIVIEEKIEVPVESTVIEPIVEKTMIKSVEEAPKIVKQEGPKSEVVLHDLKEKNHKSHDLNIEHESVNDRISKSKQPAVNLVERSKETPITDLSKAISISKKFEFINSLFDGKADIYKTCIQKVQNASNLEEAYSFLESEIVPNYDWDEHEKLAEEFFSLTRRRHM